MNVKFALRLKKFILAHPGKIKMNAFVTKITKADKDNPWKKNLDCGTVGCIAGDAVILADGVRTALELGPACRLRATELLGLDPEDATDLFWFYNTAGGHYGSYAEEREALARHNPGTKAYAKVVARAIDKCIALNGGTNV